MLKQRRFRVVLALGISLVLLAAGSLTAGPAAAGTVEDEQHFVQLINQVRADAGLPALTINSELTTGARSWASSMAANDQLAHSPNMAAGVTAQWTVLGENVGVHGVNNLQELFQAFVASPSHYQNLVDPRFQYVGVGVVHTEGGKLWTAHRFMATSTPSPTTAPPTTVPQTTVPPTTAAPTTVAPTTAAPSTAPPTTTPSTTAAPATAAPSTAPPTTAAPATVSPTTAGPGATPTGPTTTAPSTSTSAPTSTPTWLGNWPPIGQPTIGASPDQPLDQADMAELVQPDVSTITEVLIDLLEAGI